VKWDGDTFKAEGDIQNVALPGNSSHEGFYVSILLLCVVLFVESGFQCYNSAGLLNVILSALVILYMNIIDMDKRCLLGKLTFVLCKL